MHSIWMALHQQLKFDSYFFLLQLMSSITRLVSFITSPIDTPLTGSSKTIINLLWVTIKKEERKPFDQNLSIIPKICLHNPHFEIYLLCNNDDINGILNPRNWCDTEMII